MDCTTIKRRHYCQIVDQCHLGIRSNLQFYFYNHLSQYCALTVPVNNTNFSVTSLSRNGLDTCMSTITCGATYICYTVADRS